MNTTSEGLVSRPLDPLYSLNPSIAAPSSQSGVSWAAVFAGAAAAASLSLILLILGTGLGLSSISPWSGQGIAAESFGWSTIAWISFMSLAASGVGGYIAGRLRTKWTGVHTDEVYFRDTAHGFLAWAVATLLTAGLLSSAVGSVIGGAAKTSGALAGGASGAAVTATASGAAATAAPAGKPGDNGSLGYFTDSLFRKTPSANPASSANPGATGAPPPASDNAAPAAEVGRILSRAMAKGSLAPDDLHYVGQVVAQQTGMTQDDAEKRVNDTYAKMQADLQEAKTAAEDDANKARKASAYVALWLFVSLLLGAFTASLLATFGGRLRDLSHTA